MFKGKKCTDRCMNSISILKRQPHATKLETCYCDGTEDFDCVAVKSNMEKLCFQEDNEISDNEIDVEPSSASSWSAKFEKIFIFFTIFMGLVINWVGASFNVMIDAIKTTNEEPQAPPEEIGVQ